MVKEKDSVKEYSYSDFASSQDAAIQRILHHAQDHMLASRVLRGNPIFLDSSAYLCSLAFELLLKAVHLSERGKFRRTHNIMELNESLDMKLIAKKDSLLLKVIDKYSLTRYPVDQDLHKKYPVFKLGQEIFSVDEIGTQELEKADTLFFKQWKKLRRLKAFKQLISNINSNPYQKGNRIIMRKRRLTEA